MRKKGYKGRCEKKDLSKSQEVCRTYDAIQSNYADILQNDNDIQEIRCNVLLDGLSEGAYTSDFVYYLSGSDSGEGCGKNKSVMQMRKDAVTFSNACWNDTIRKELQKPSFDYRTKIYMVSSHVFGL